MPESKRRDYCFTVNNYTDDDLEKLKELEDSPRVRYIIAAKEVGAQGTPHVQGYVYFHNATAFSTLQKYIPRGAISACRGSPEQNIAYCSKDGEFYEKGERPVSQKRKGELGFEYWSANKKLAIEGRLDDVDPKLFLTHYRTLKLIASDHALMPADNQDFDNHWYYGDTGSGKSYKARNENPGHYLKMCNKWWDGYANEDVAIIEDFDKSHSVLGHHLKIWADRYAFPAEVKGSKVNLRPKKIIVTSNWHPSEIWVNEPQTLLPITRRFKITHFQINLNQASPYPVSGP